MNSLKATICLQNTYYFEQYMLAFAEWFFDGLGTAIITLIIGLITGGAVGYRVGIKNTINQKQSAGDNSTQTQVGRDYHAK